jgi:hypothetical protein
MGRACNVHMNKDDHVKDFSGKAKKEKTARKKQR